MKTGNSIFSVLEGLWEWTWSVDHGNRIASCKKDDWRLLGKDFKSKPIKEKGKNPKSTVSRAFKHWNSQ